MSTFLVTPNNPSAYPELVPMWLCSQGQINMLAQSLLAWTRKLKLMTGKIQWISYIYMIQGAFIYSGYMVSFPVGVREH